MVFKVYRRNVTHNHLEQWLVLKTWGKTNLVTTPPHKTADLKARGKKTWVTKKTTYNSGSQSCFLGPILGVNKTQNIKPTVFLCLVSNEDIACISKNDLSNVLFIWIRFAMQLFGNGDKGYFMNRGWCLFDSCLALGSSIQSWEDRLRWHIMFLVFMLHLCVACRCYTTRVF